LHIGQGAFNQMSTNIRWNIPVECKKPLCSCCSWYLFY